MNYKNIVTYVKMYIIINQNGINKGSKKYNKKRTLEGGERHGI